MSKHFSDGRLIVFTKAPEPGKVKTRLIPALGPEGAADLYRELLENKLAQVTGYGISAVDLYCAPSKNHQYFQEIRSRFNLGLYTQSGQDLGQRMANAINSSLKENKMVVIIGSDCPALDKEYLLQAFTALERGSDAVIGPADDGGYVLIGLRRLDRSIFTNIDWGSENVLSQTMSRFADLNYSVEKLANLWDVDRPEDLELYQEYKAENLPGREIRPGVQS